MTTRQTARPVRRVFTPTRSPGRRAAWPARRVFTPTRSCSTHANPARQENFRPGTDRAAASHAPKAHTNTPQAQYTARHAMRGRTAPAKAKVLARRHARHAQSRATMRTTGLALNSTTAFSIASSVPLDDGVTNAGRYPAMIALLAATTLTMERLRNTTTRKSIASCVRITRLVPSLAGPNRARRVLLGNAPPTSQRRFKITIMSRTARFVNPVIFSITPLHDAKRVLKVNLPQAAWRAWRVPQGITPTTIEALAWHASSEERGKTAKNAKLVNSRTNQEKESARTALREKSRVGTSNLPPRTKPQPVRPVALACLQTWQGNPCAQIVR